MSYFSFIFIGLCITCSCHNASSQLRDDQQDLPTPQPTEPTPIVVNDACMQCLCYAASGCDRRLKCHKRTPSSSILCGPYVAGVQYWIDGGRHGDTGNPKDYERCLTDRECTEKTVRDYMNRYGEDCDRDSRITCDDFARIHKLGPGTCGKEIRGTNFWKRYMTCKLRIRVE